MIVQLNRHVYTVCAQNKANHFLAQCHETAAKYCNFWDNILRHNCTSEYAFHL